MMNKVLLIFPMLHSKGDSAFATDSAMPLGIVNLAAKLIENNIETIIVDQQKVNADYQFFVNLIKRKKITHVGISLSFPNPEVFPFVEKIKMNFPKIRVFLGGPLASYLNKIILEKNDNIDFIILGEGETPIVEVISQDTGELFGISMHEKLKKINGVAFVSHGNYINTGFNRENQIVPNVYSKAKVDLSNYKQVNLAFSKGCPFGCYFCLVTQYFGKKVIYADPEKVAEEIEYISQNFNIRSFSFVDDTFGLNIEKLRLLVNEIENRKLNNFYYWVGTRYDVISDEVIELFCRMGVKCVALGTESVNKKTRTLLRKNNNVDMMRDVIQKLHLRNIKVETSAILGLPNETYNDFIETIDVLGQLEFDVVHISNLIMIPGASLYSHYSEFGIKKEREFENLEDYMVWDKYRMNHGYYTSDTSSLDDIQKAFEYAYEKFGNKLVEKNFKEAYKATLYENPIY